MHLSSNTYSSDQVIENGTQALITGGVKPCSQRSINCSLVHEKLFVPKQYVVLSVALWGRLGIPYGPKDSCVSIVQPPTSPLIKVQLENPSAMVIIVFIVFKA